MVSDGTARPYRVKIKSPDYASLQAIDTLGRGYYIADVVAIIGSLDVVLEVSIDNSVVFTLLWQRQKEPIRMEFLLNSNLDSV
jgi:Ni,Fe-hydrogenase III large subunit